MPATLSATEVGTLVAERPARSRVFERWQIDYCCGGRVPLEEACAARGVDLRAVLADLAAVDATPDEAGTDWMSAPLTELADHIVATHHAYLREALPRLTDLTQKVRNAHGANHPELAGLANTYASFRADMEEHAAKEEQVLFPYIRALDAAQTAPEFRCGSVHNAIERMEQEHEAAGADLALMREITSGFTAPADACNTWRAMLDGLRELEADTHVHVHKENSILFPRAAAREDALRSA